MNSSEHLAAVDLVKREIKSAQYHMAFHINMALIRAGLDRESAGDCRALRAGRRSRSVLERLHCSLCIGRAGSPLTGYRNTDIIGGG